MRQASVSKIVLAFLLVLCNSLFGCSVEKRQTFPTVEQSAENQELVWVVSEEMHKTVLRNVLGDKRVQVCAEFFATLGLGQEPFGSVSIQAIGTDGKPVTVRIITFLSPDSAGAAVCGIKASWQNVAGLEREDRKVFTLACSCWKAHPEIAVVVATGP